MSTLGSNIKSTESRVTAPTKRTYFSIGTSSNGLLRWNSNTRYTDWYVNLPGTLEIWLYMDTSTGYTFGASWIFHMKKSLAIRIKDANGEIGCSHSKQKISSFSSFVTHFPSFVQYDEWNHLACVFNPTTIDFAYN